MKRSIIFFIIITVFLSGCSLRFKWLKPSVEQENIQGNVEYEPKEFTFNIIQPEIYDQFSYQNKTPYTGIHIKNIGNKERYFTLCYDYPNDIYMVHPVLQPNDVYVEYEGEISVLDNPGGNYRLLQPAEEVILYMRPSWGLWRGGSLINRTGTHNIEGFVSVADSEEDIIKCSKQNPFDVIININ